MRYSAEGSTLRITYTQRDNAWRQFFEEYTLYALANNHIVRRQTLGSDGYYQAANETLRDTAHNDIPRIVPVNATGKLLNAIMGKPSVYPRNFETVVITYAGDSRTGFFEHSYTFEGYKQHVDDGIKRMRRDLSN